MLALRSIEKRTSSGAATHVGPEPGPTDNDRLTIAQCVWAAHYLLVKAGMSYATVDKTAVARFVSALTGYGFENVYKRVKDKHGKNEKASQQDLATVSAWFTSLGLDEIAKKIDAERNMG